MKEEFELALQNFMSALSKVLKHFDEKQKKALALLLECESLKEQSKTMKESSLKLLAHDYLLEKGITWGHSEEFEQVWKVYYLA